MKKIFYIFFILFITSKVHAVNVNSMTPSYWSTAFSPENEIKEHADLVFNKPVVYNSDTRLSVIKYLL